ncbi:hypothetical protein [Nocardia concava]|uniref:hypothetical protein n=1 Tax=Nocardia concava TaxID=257281 RepID=UPI0002E09777|nr:hypothetical protein [Nocardia concava]
MSSLEQRFAEFIAQLRGLDTAAAAEQADALRTRLEALEFEMRLTPAATPRLAALTARYREAAELLVTLLSAPTAQPNRRGRDPAVET